MSGSEEAIAVPATIGAVEYWERREEHEHSELVAGVVVPMSKTGVRHGAVEFRVAYLLQRAVEALGQGLVITGEVGFRIDEDTVRALDAAVFLDPPAEIDGWLDAPPDLAIEVVSPGDRWASLSAKVGQYLEAGVREVWVVDPGSRTVTVRRGPGEAEVLAEDQTLTTPLLPAFAVVMRELFDLG
jgi:Uma2 family endonuclease